MEQDIRWKQQFANFEKAFGQLSEFIEKGNLNKFELLISLQISNSI
jgi:hypothetical protein